VKIAAEDAPSADGDGGDGFPEECTGGRTDEINLDDPAALSVDPFLAYKKPASQRSSAACGDERVQRAKSINELLPRLYLEGSSTCYVSRALAALSGPDAPRPLGRRHQPSMGGLTG